MTGADRSDRRLGFNALLYVWGLIVFAFVFALNAEMLPNAERILCADEWVIDFGKFNDDGRCAKFSAEELTNIPNTLASATRELTSFYPMLQISILNTPHVVPTLFLFDEQIYVHQQIYPESDVVVGGVGTGLMILADKLLLLIAVFLIVLLPASYFVRYTTYVLVGRLGRANVVDWFFHKGYVRSLLIEFPLSLVFVTTVILAAGEYQSSLGDALDMLTQNGGDMFGQFTSHYGDFLLIAFASGLFALLVSHVVDALFIACQLDPSATYLDDLLTAVVVGAVLSWFTEAGLATIASAIVLGLLHSLLRKTLFEGAVREA